MLRSEEVKGIVHLKANHAFILTHSIISRMFPFNQNEDVFTFDRDKSLSRAALKREAFKQARMLSLSPNFERQGKRFISQQEEENVTLL